MYVGIIRIGISISRVMEHFRKSRYQSTSNHSGIYTVVYQISRCSVLLFQQLNFWKLIVGRKIVGDIQNQQWPGLACVVWSNSTGQMCLAALVNPLSKGLVPRLRFSLNMVKMRQLYSESIYNPSFEQFFCFFNRKIVKGSEYRWVVCREIKNENGQSRWVPHKNVIFFMSVDV